MEAQPIRWRAACGERREEPPQEALHGAGGQAEAGARPAGAGVLGRAPAGGQLLWDAEAEERTPRRIGRPRGTVEA